MKTLSLILSVLISLGSSASSYNIVKIDDGTLVHCRKKSDVWNGRNQSYSVSGISISREEEHFFVKVHVNLKQCKQLKNGTFKLVDVNPMEDYTYFVPWAGTNGNHVSVKTNWLKFQAHRDGVYNILMNDFVSTTRHQDESRHTLGVIAVTDLLSTDEANALDDGEEVKVSFDFYLQRNVTTTGTLNPDFSPTRTVSYGKFRFLLNLKAGEDNVLFENVAFRKIHL